MHHTAEEPLLTAHHFAVLTTENMQRSINADHRGIVRHVERLRKQQSRVHELATLKPTYKRNQASGPARVGDSVAPYRIQRSELSTCR